MWRQGTAALCLAFRTRPILAEGQRERERERERVSELRYLYARFIALKSMETWLSKPSFSLKGCKLPSREYITILGHADIKDSLRGRSMLDL